MPRWWCRMVGLFLPPCTAQAGRFATLSVTALHALLDANRLRVTPTALPGETAKRSSTGGNQSRFCFQPRPPEPFVESEAPSSDHFTFSRSSTVFAANRLPNSAYPSFV
jgi:hypothetical protein